MANAGILLSFTGIICHFELFGKPAFLEHYQQFLDKLRHFTDNANVFIVIFSGVRKAGISRALSTIFGRISEFHNGLEV